MPGILPHSIAVHVGCMRWLHVLSTDFYTIYLPYAFIPSRPPLPVAATALCKIAVFNCDAVKVAGYLLA